MTESMIVFAIVAIAAIFVIRHLTRSLRGEDKTCQCGTQQCPSASTCANVPKPKAPRPH